MTTLKPGVIYTILRDEDVRIFESQLDTQLRRVLDGIPETCAINLFDENSYIRNIKVYARSVFRPIQNSLDMCYIESLPNKTLYIVDLGEGQEELSRW